MAEEKEKPLTREDVLRLIKENGGPEGLDLSRATFVEAIDLSGLDLHGIILKEAKFPTSFKREIVEGADLRGSHLEKADLTKAHLERAELHETHLEGANLRDAHLEGAFLWDTHLQGANLRDAHLEGAFLWDTHLQGANLMSTHLQGANLMRTKFSPDVSLESVDWGNYILGEEKDGYFDAAVDTYRRLKAWYSQSGYGDTAGKFYYREKEAGRKALKWRSKLWYHRLALEASYRFFGYGERWEGILIWIAVVVFGLATAYHFWGSFSSSSFWDTLYYSATSFTALGYGKWAPQPTGWAKGMGAAEAIIGVFMMALLLVTFVRKWTR